MIRIDVENKQLVRQIQKLKDADNIIGSQFGVAGRKVSRLAVRDLQSGVASVSGELRGLIGAEVKTLTGGIEAEMVIHSLAEHSGYNYGARLDKDGSMRWRTGRFRGRRTFGWFTEVLKRLLPKLARREYQKALDRAVQELKIK